MVTIAQLCDKEKRIMVASRNENEGGSVTVTAKMKVVMERIEAIGGEDG